MADFNPDKVIFDEARVLLRLHGRHENPLFTRGLRELAWKGERLQKRYENACMYAWASGPSYEGVTSMLERAIVALARDCGLHAFIQGDPRGATVYVAREPLDDMNYSSIGEAIFYGDDA